MGLMLTAVNRKLDAGSTPYLRSGAYTGGIDLRRRFWSKNYEVRTFAAMSDMLGSQQAISALQTNTVHAYQRPDDQIAFDSLPDGLPALLARLRVQRPWLPAARRRAALPQLVRAAVSAADQVLPARV